MLSVEVSLYGRILGYLYWDDSRGCADFEYASDFASSGLQPSPLVLPARAGVVYSFPELKGETFRGLPGMIADSLPDRYGRELLKTYLALLGRREENPLEALCYLGSRCMGALEFRPSYELSAARDFEISTLVDVASEALSRKEDFLTSFSQDRKKAVADILSLSTSAGGQRAKAVIAYNKKTGEVRSGQVDAPDGFRHCLIKLDGVCAGSGLSETNNYGRLEWSFYKLATSCGITMSECSLVEENGRAHFLTERFDRRGNEKIHMQTLCAIAHYDFNLLRTYSWEQCFGVMRQLGLPYGDMTQMFRRIVLNTVIRNQDDHTKNVSFLMDGKGRWSLSPAYDVGYNYNPAGGWTSKHQMSVCGKFEDICSDDLLRMGESAGISRPEKIIGEIVDASREWPSIASGCGVPDEMITSRFENFELTLC